MILRRVNLLWGIVALISLVSLPWWFTLAILILSIVLTKRSLEGKTPFFVALPMALLADLVYGTPNNFWLGFQFWFTGSIIVVMIIAQLINHFIDFNP